MEDCDELSLVETVISVVCTDVDDILLEVTCDDLVSLNLKLDLEAVKLGFSDESNSFANVHQR